MPFFAPLVAALKADSTVNGLAPDRVTPNEATQGASLPYITYRIATSEHIHAHDGNSCLASGLFIVTCWAQYYDDAWTLAEAVRVALNGMTGLHTGVTFGSVICSGMSDTPDTQVDGGENSTKGVQLVFNVWYKETA